MTFEVWRSFQLLEIHPAGLRKIQHVVLFEGQLDGFPVVVPILSFHEYSEILVENRNFSTPALLVLLMADKPLMSTAFPCVRSDTTLLTSSVSMLWSWSVFYCTHVRMSYVLNSYLLTYLLNQPTCLKLGQMLINLRFFSTNTHF